MTQRTSIMGVVALGLGAVAVGEVFVPSALGQPRVNSLRGAGKGADAGASISEGLSSSSVAVLGVAAMTAMAASRGRGTPRTACRAEPISAAAAAAAAAAMKGAAAVKGAAAATGAVKAAGAVAGSSGAGSLAQNEKETDFDEYIATRNPSIRDRGTPEYKKWLEERKKAKEVAWAVQTGRSESGNFGAMPTKRQGGNSYDPLEATTETWQQEIREKGLYAGDFDPSRQLGAMAPLGYFDPLGFCKQGNEQGFRNLRAAEIKHGRVAMMAALGAVVQHYFKFPGFGTVPSGLDAVNNAPGSYGMIALVAVSGFLELAVWKENPQMAPGNFGDPLGLNQYNQEMREREINNGRFAMFAAIGIMAAEVFTGKDCIEQLGA